MNNTLYQYGTLGLLVPGLFEGTNNLENILSHGDTGIGTGDGLDGELIIIDGTPYQVNGNGETNKLNLNFSVPFADVHYANFSKIFEINQSIRINNLFEKFLNEVGTKNIFLSIKIHGVFSSIKTRSVKKQSKPYTTLEDSANNQRTFQSNNVKGTIIGYYSPELFNGPSVGGFHVHFLADDLSIGGHVLDFELDKGNIYFQRLDKFEQQLPKNKEFLNYDFTNTNIEHAIKKAEKN